ncbi:hypothetical protein BKH43_00155 [Helicobacter sp. 13S00401-1]|uniref:chaperone NapD n=1 Tax=Helicobacter sp. 13S00401-1 TaxID=1905758 RepID=UPI000BC3D6D2|nr:chaperone NapD [Helicobacter sp. 13S00401-1]PAF51691.1 hypothetical protein BKH43_00155 [Helicobacter sp. 13S00401-1]
METISSIIIRTKKDKLEKVASELEKLECVEVGLKEKDTIIALISTETTEEQLSIFQNIQGLSDIMDVQMHYSYSDELNFQDTPEFEEVLKDINTQKDAASITYSGNMHRSVDRTKRLKRS